MLGSCSTFVVAWSRPNTAHGALSAIPLQKRARRNDPNSLKGMQCKQVRIAGHNVSRLSAYSERKKLVILRIAAGGYLHIDIDPLRLAGQDSEKTPHVFFINVTTKLLPAQNLE
jgi:hypothetical protein